MKGIFPTLFYITLKLQSISSFKEITEVILFNSNNIFHQQRANKTQQTAFKCLASSVVIKDINILT